MRELAERVARGRKAIALAKLRGLDTSEWELRLKELFDAAGRKPAFEEGLEPLMLWEWRRVSLPEWRRILQESIGSGNTRREEYARWGRNAESRALAIILRQLRQHQSLVKAIVAYSDPRPAMTALSIGRRDFS